MHPETLFNASGKLAMVGFGSDCHLSRYGVCQDLPNRFVWLAAPHCARLTAEPNPPGQLHRRSCNGSYWIRR
jgi:hypothetical protein